MVLLLGIAGDVALPPELNPQAEIHAIKAAMQELEVENRKLTTLYTDLAAHIPLLVNSIDWNQHRLMFTNDLRGTTHDALQSLTQLLGQFSSSGPSYVPAPVL